MKKYYSHDELSDVKCATKGCDRLLKRRMVEQKPTVRVCFKCYKEAQHRFPTANRKEYYR